MKFSCCLPIIFLLIYDLLPGMGLVQAYPLDGYLHANIQRLEGVLKIQQGKLPGKKLPAGALLSIKKVDIRLMDHPDIQIPAPDPDLTLKIRSLLGKDKKNYGIALLDITDITTPRYAAVHDSFRANPGSVGKLMVALGIFQALADIYPNDREKRLHILWNTIVRADAFIQSDHHRVPFQAGDKRHIFYRPIHQGDQAGLWTWLDWMLSASSNAAAAMVQKELMLMVRFGRAYPVTLERARSFFTHTSKKKLGEWFKKSLQDPLTRNGLDLNMLRQGSFFTWKGKSYVPGTTSYATPKALVKFLLKMEQGKLVDPFSSREIKRLIYMTGKRIRYASSPALYQSAVYFKSGSLYKCRPEPGFRCHKYMGNVLNQLSSIAIIESPANKPRLHYIVAVMSNILYKNSAVAHQTLATRIHRLMEKDHGIKQPSSKKGHLQK